MLSLSPELGGTRPWRPVSPHSLRPRSVPPRTPSRSFPRRLATRSWRVQVETEANRLELDLQASIDALASDRSPRYEVIDEIRWQVLQARCIADHRKGPERKELTPSRELGDQLRFLLREEVKLPDVRPPTRWARLVELWNGAEVEAARAALHRAREALLLVQPSDTVLAQLPPSVPRSMRGSG